MPCARTLLLAAVLFVRAIAASAGADRALPAALAESSAVLDATRAVRAEMDALGTQPAGPVRDAKVAVRRVAFDLLFHGAAGDGGGQASAIAGLRMWTLRSDLDRAIEGAAAGGRTEDARARGAFARFAQAAQHGLANAPDPARPEAALGEVIKPLEEAVSFLESRGGAPWSTAWPSEESIGAAARTEGKAGDRRESAHGSGGAPLPGWAAEQGAALRALAAGAAAGVDAGAQARASRARASLEAIDRLDPGALAAELRAAATELRARCIGDARSALAALGSPESPARREAMDAALEAIEMRGDDARRAAAVPAWIDAIGAARAPSRAAFAAAARQWLITLRDPARAGTARASMAAFESDLRALEPGSLELRLRRQDPRARDACAGRADDLLRESDARRSAWAQSWSDGRGKPDVSIAAIRAARALEAIDAADSAAAAAADERALGAWGGFAASAEGWRVHPRALRGRAALVAEALVARDEPALGTALSALERDLPLAMLAGRLARDLGDWLPTRAGTGPRLAAVRDAPAAEAWLGAHRADLMLLSRAAVEEERARARRDSRLEADLRTLASGLAWHVLEDLSLPAQRLRALQGAEQAAAARGSRKPPSAR